MFKLIRILKYVKANPDCVTPEIRDFLQIEHSDPPDQEEKELYKIINTLVKEGYIRKNPFKERELGGPHFSLQLTDLGKEYLNELRISGEELFQDKIFDQFGSSLRLNVLENLKDKLTKPIKSEILHGIDNALETLRKTYFLNKKNT